MSGLHDNSPDNTFRVGTYARVTPLLALPQMEKYADIYTSRVSNFLRYTPYMYFRSPSQGTAHDKNLTK